MRRTGVLLEELDEPGHRLCRLVEGGEEPVEGLIREPEGVVVLEHRLGSRGHGGICL
jgi:hypothetical protein